MPGAFTQARDQGYASASVSAQLEPSTLSQRVQLVVDGAQRARQALAWQAPVGGGAGRRPCFNLASLPHAVALHVLSFLPVDARARAALVCRAWRALTGERSLWTTLDLSLRGGVQRPVSDALLRNAAARAGGQLTMLNVDDCVALTQPAVLEVLTANSGSLREVSWCGPYLRFEAVDALVRAAPQLRKIKVDAGGSVAATTRMLRNEPPFGALQLRTPLITHMEGADAPEELDAIVAAISGHAAVKRLVLHAFPLDVAALLDFVLTPPLIDRLDGLFFVECRLSPVSVPALVRAIRGGKLPKEFGIMRGGQLLLDEPAAAQLADAIAADRSLVGLALESVGFWRDSAGAAILLRALTGHPSLCYLELTESEPPDQAAAGAALAALVAANTPALHRLVICGTILGDAGMEPLLDALEHNTHLQELNCCDTGMSYEFARERVLLAVGANTSLRKLFASEPWGGDEGGEAPPELWIAEDLVAARAAADAAA